MDTNTRTACGRPARFTLVGGVRGFLAAVGLGGVLTASAFAQPQPQPQNRPVGLLPPQPLAAGEMPPVARGASNDAPTGQTTPVVRPSTPIPGKLLAQGSGPARPNGPDAGVQPASGTALQPAVVHAAPMPGAPVAGGPVHAASREELSPARGPDRVRGAIGSGEQRPPTMNPNPNAVSVTPDASTPFRSQAANGAAVYAGPPAYRWYGYGAVTPGANPYAPTGEYPKASANWYSVTGATPGAFPVPVMNPLRSPPGVEPPTYAVSSPARAASQVTNHPSAGADTSKFEQTPTTAEPPRFAPQPTPITPVSPAVQPEPPAEPVNRTAAAPSPVGVPALTPAPGMAPLPPVQPIPVKPVEPVVGSMPAPIVGSAPVPPTGPVAPAGSPVRRSGGEDIRWQPTGGGAAAPADGTWVPAGAPHQPGAARSVPQPIARGQVDDGQPADPNGELIRAMCRGRANGIDVRWTGEKRVTVSFEARTEAEAANLVKDISARPELAPLQIDFRVLVK